MRLTLSKRYFEFATTAALLLMGSQLHAQNWEISAIQYSLKRLGYYSSTVDGLDGPATRNAIQEYADAKGIAAERFDVMMSIPDVIGGLPWQLEPSERLHAAVNEALETELLDFGSAKMSDYFVAHLGENERRVSACVEVNSRNSAVAYTGFQRIALTGHAFTISGETRYAMGILPVSGFEADVLCVLGHVVE